MNASGGFGEWEQVGTQRRNGDLAWLGLLLSVISAFLMIALVWWLVS